MPVPPRLVHIPAPHGNIGVIIAHPALPALIGLTLWPRVFIRGAHARLPGDTARWPYALTSIHQSAVCSSHLDSLRPGRIRVFFKFSTCIIQISSKFGQRFSRLYWRHDVILWCWSRRFHQEDHLISQLFYFEIQTGLKLQITFKNSYIKLNLYLTSSWYMFSFWTKFIQFVQFTENSNAFRYEHSPRHVMRRFIPRNHQHAHPIIFHQPQLTSWP